MFIGTDSWFRFLFICISLHMFVTCWTRLFFISAVFLLDDFAVFIANLIVIPCHALDFEIFPFSNYFLSCINIYGLRQSNASISSVGKLNFHFILFRRLFLLNWCWSFSDITLKIYSLCSTVSYKITFSKTFSIMRHDWIRKSVFRRFPYRE